MSWFNLDPESLVARPSNPPVAPPTLAASVTRGIIGFTMVSVAGFVPWAVFGKVLYRQIGEIGMYLVCAVVFIGLSGPALHRLIIGPGSLRKFYKVFSLAFIAYAVLWIAAWVLLRGHLGSVVGLLAGTAAMGGILASAFRAGHLAGKVIAILFLLNAAGYFIGGWVEAALFERHRLAAMLLWGVCYGIGFGAGLGWAFHVCQTEARRILTTKVASA